MSTAVHTPIGTAGAGTVRAIRIVWKRELIRFARDRARMITALVQPLPFLFVLGTGMGHNFAAGPGLSYRTFLFPGILAMTVLFTAVFAAVSIVWDREFGFLREMLVAPVPRPAILLGKCAGGATVSTLQGTIVLALAGLVGVPYTPGLLLTLLAEMFLAGLMLTSIGLAIASRIRQVQSFGVVVQPVILPMFFLSGAPSSRSPASPAGSRCSPDSTPSPTSSIPCAAPSSATCNSHHRSPTPWRQESPGPDGTSPPPSSSSWSPWSQSPPSQSPSAASNTPNRSPRGPLASRSSSRSSCESGSGSARGSRGVTRIRLIIRQRGTALPDGASGRLCGRLARPAVAATPPPGRWSRVLRM
jgi:daunorubicin resistance ABC transporter membrane protein